jgi:hypothetical protein
MSHHHSGLEASHRDGPTPTSASAARSSDEPCEPEDAARELPILPLEDALQLVHLYVDRGSPKFETAAMRWLERYLTELAQAPALRGDHGESRRKIEGQAGPTLAHIPQGKGKAASARS